MSADQLDLATFGSEVVPEGACVRYGICEQVVPGRGQMCADCLDAVRAADRERQDGEA